jgi:Spy/CpxP family protein refolding chaperone
VNSKSRTLGRVGAVGAATMLGVAALAVVAPAASAAPCGYYKTADYDMYNHCGPGRLQMPSTCDAANHQQGNQY